jgi:hypothetical protein
MDQVELLNSIRACFTFETRPHRLSHNLLSPLITLFSFFVGLLNIVFQSRDTSYCIPGGLRHPHKDGLTCLDIGCLANRADTKFSVEDNVIANQIQVFSISTRGRHQ